MKQNKNEMEKVLREDLEISPLVEKRIQDTYLQLEDHKKAGKGQYHLAKRLATAAALVITLSGTTAFAAYAYNNSTFLQSTFGNETRKSNDQMTIQQDTGKGSTCEVTLPANEYVATDPEIANYMKPYISNIDKVVTLGNHKLTVLSHLTNGKVGVIAYKLECNTGVTMLDVDDIKNRTKGCSFSLTTKEQFDLRDAEGAPVYEKLWYDQRNSNKNCYYLYQTYLCEDPRGVQNLKTMEFDMSDGEQIKKNVSREIVKEQMVDIKADKLVNDKIKAKKGDNTILEISSMGLSLDLACLDQFKNHEKGVSMEISDVDSIVIHDTDGKKYVVVSDSSNIDNTNALLGGTGESGEVVQIAFNRMIDTNKIDKVTVGKETIQIKK